MSASLVGSEMCIRDSFKLQGGRPASRAERFLPGCARDLCRSALRHLSEAVSYTHLTLPTICSV
eukprot:11603710-Alexandrium_andersonii.AAC.1